MARTREQIISEMVDSGLFTDDEIRAAVKQSPGGGSQLSAQASSVLQGEPPRPMAHPAEMVKRLATDTLEGFRPPISMEETKRFLNPNAAQYGPNRFAQDVIDTTIQSAPQQAEQFVETPGINRFPNVAAALGVGGIMGANLLSSPKGIQQAVGLGKLTKLGIAGEQAMRNAGAKLGKAAISVVSPASLDAVNARFANPSAVKNAMTREQLGNAVVSSTNKLRSQIGELDTAAKNTLSGEQTLPKEKIVNELQQLKQRYVGSAGVAISQEAKSAIAEIDNVIKGLGKVNPLPDTAPIHVMPGKKAYTGPGGFATTKHGKVETFPGGENRFGQTVSEGQTKDIMSQFKNINWNDPAGGAKKEVRKIFDRVLKAENPEYEAAMKPVAERAKLQSIVEKKLGLKYDPTAGTYATDATAGKWTPAMLEGKKPETSQALKRLGKLTGTDLLEKAKMTNYREQFTGGKTQGSRMVQLGRHVAGVPGAVLGAAFDRLGGDLSGKLIDALASIPTLPSMSESAQRAVVLALSNALRNRKEPANAR